MAITTPQPASHTTPPTSHERVEAWDISATADALQNTHLDASTPAPAVQPPRGTTTALDIPLDALLPTATVAPLHPRPTKPRDPVHTVHKRPTPINRASTNRREALLKGKEGSRARRRWENARLLDNPHAQPPLPSDWEVRPTYPRRAVPYFLAPLWEGEFKRQAERAGRGAYNHGGGEGERGAAEAVAQEVRAKLKRAKGAKGWLRDLEEEVRGFVEGVDVWGMREGEEVDSEDEEIVFVGRDAGMSDEKRRAREEEKRRDKLVFESLVGENGGAFGRYLVHSIAQYYGLNTWSVTVGDPARREAYVGLKVDPESSLVKSELPRPLWSVV